MISSASSGFVEFEASTWDMSAVRVALEREVVRFGVLNGEL